MERITGRGFLCCIGVAAVAAFIWGTHAARAETSGGHLSTANSVLRSPGDACVHAALERYQYTQLHMGVQVRITLYAPDRDAAERAGTAAFMRYAELEDVMSDYRPASELMRLCAKAGGPPVPVSKELFYVLEKAQQIARRSNGAFDVTVSPVVRLWRAARKSGKLPPEEDIRAALKLVGWKKVKLDPRKRTVQLLQPGMQLDLGGIGKGYANDEAMLALKKHGIRSAMLEAGGDILVSDAPPGRQGWVIDLANPGPHAQRMVVTNCAVSTSGDTEQFVEIDGQRYSHVVDPRTGLGLTTRVAATVIAPKGILADALSKAAAILDDAALHRLEKLYRGVKSYVRRVTD